MSRPFVVAHRGGASEHLENTLPAFCAGARAGADMIEVDCRLTRDGHVVTVHDPDLARLWHVPAAVHELDWVEVRDISSGGYGIPRLEEVLDALDVRLMLDLPGPKVAIAVLQLLRRAGALGRCVLAGGLPALGNIRRCCPEAGLVLSWDSRDLPAPSRLEKLRPRWFNPHWRVVSSDVVSAAHSLGIGVCTWTVNHRWALAKVSKAGADALVTDRPAWVLAHS